MVSCVIDMICGFPNLVTLEIWVSDMHIIILNYKSSQNYSRICRQRDEKLLVQNAELVENYNSFSQKAELVENYNLFSPKLGEN